MILKHLKLTGFSFKHAWSMVDFFFWLFWEFGIVFNTGV